MLATVSIVMASVLGVIWGWIVWIVIGGIAGILGGLLGGFILGLFSVDVNGIIWTFVTALAGAIVLLLIVHLITGGRGIGMRHR